jgi:hypothetical protein
MCGLLIFWAYRIDLPATVGTSNGAAGIADGAKLPGNQAALKKTCLQPQTTETGTLPA